MRYVTSSANRQGIEKGTQVFEVGGGTCHFEKLVDELLLLIGIWETASITHLLRLCVSMNAGF